MLGSYLLCDPVLDLGSCNRLVQSKQRCSLASVATRRTAETMSPSSSGSWSGTRGADIIDLDRYMRGAVRPTRPVTQRSNCGPELVVDAGGVIVKPTADPRHKRYSHDSGVSDSSYSRHRRVSRSHRRLSNIEGPRAHAVAPTPTRGVDSSDSLRQFRTVCEQALLEQQRQIAHVAQLCEKLTERAEKSERGGVKERNISEPINERSEQKEAKIYTHPEQDIEQDSPVETERTDNDRSARYLKSPQKCRSYILKNNRQIHRKEKTSSEMSDISSSSRSTRDPRRKDKHRTQQCKTYKIIMSKLDELNRLFATRTPSPAPRVVHPHSPSSSSVTVCDKVVATDPQRTVNKIIIPTSVRSRRMPTSQTPGVRQVTQAYAVDIPPKQAKPNVITESVRKMSARGSMSSATSDRCGFDLDDPVHLYSQAKKLQAPPATSARRGRSVDRSNAGSGASSDSRAGDVRVSRVAQDKREPRDLRHDRCRHGSPSLCAVCRDYWRCLRQCLLPQMFSAPDHCQC